MILAALLLPVAIGVLLLCVQRFRLPAFLALMAVVVGYGIAANMTIQSIGKAFGLGFASAIEQAGLLVVAGSLLRLLLLKESLPTPAAAAAGVLAGLGGSAAGGLALLQGAGAGAARRTLGLAFILLAVHALVVPAPLAVAAASVLRASTAAFWITLPTAAIAATVGWLFAASSTVRDPERGRLSIKWLAVVVPLGLLVVQAIAQMPTEPMGKGGAREFYTGISHPLILLVLAVGLALLLAWRWQPEALADTRWAPLLLAVGAAGGFARVLDETGMAELLAEHVLDPTLGPTLGLLVPFLAAAVVKTLQGNSLSAVLTASGMVEPMLPALGLDSDAGRALAAAAAGAGSIAICHVNDPFFWIAAHMAELSPARALRTISLGSLVVAVAALIVLVVLHLIV